MHTLTDFDSFFL